MRGPIRPQEAGQTSSSTGDDSSSSLPLPVRLVTFNVRYATRTPAAGEAPWHVRAPRLCAQLRFATTGHDAAFLCLQEALYEQLQDIHQRLCQEVGGDDDDDSSGSGGGDTTSEWAYIGAGRDDGRRAGEFSPVFYRPRVWHLERSRVYWLSPTPDRPSRGWDAALNRVVTVGRFRHRATGRPLVVMSTHFDHVGVQARQESARLILTIADAWRRSTDCDTASGSSSASEDVPIFLGGDFNSEPHDGAYQTITAAPGGMTDLAGQLAPASRYGNDAITYTSFGEPGEAPKRIDFLFFREPSAVRVRTFAVLANRFDDGVFLSDHRAVVSDVEIAPPADD